MTVGVPADERLKHRRRDLINQRNQSDLRHIERQRDLNVRINRRNQRLHGIVKRMKRRERGKNEKRCFFRCGFGQGKMLSPKVNKMEKSFLLL